MILTKINLFFLIYGIWIILRFFNIGARWEYVTDNAYFLDGWPDFFYYPTVFFICLVRTLALPTIAMAIIYIIAF